MQEAIEILAQNAHNRIPVTIISETEPTEPCEIWLKPMGGVSILDATGGETILSAVNITGVHIGDEPPTDTSKLWFKPIQQG